MNKSKFYQGLWLFILFCGCVGVVIYQPSSPLPVDAFAYTSATPSPDNTSITPIRVSVEYSLSPAPTPMTLPPTPTPTAEPTPFCIYWVSDTQYYSYKVPAVFQKMSRYMVESKAEHNALMVVNTGDIVDNRNYDRHWRNAKSAIDLLGDELPFYCVAGNHDVGADTAEYTTYHYWDFCAMKNRDNQYERGECWYETFNAGGTDFLLLGIGWQVDLDYMPWCESVLKEHPKHVCIILVHNFLNDDGSLTTNGRRIEQRLIAPFSCVRLVLCGHNDGSARWQKDYSGRTVNAMMYNFQDDKKYGLGYLRMLMFNPITRNIAVTTYSPYVDDYNYYKDTDRDTFTLSDGF